MPIGSTKVPYRSNATTLRASSAMPCSLSPVPGTTLSGS
jgi:hypothetical protein